jgi:hypothetical protein
LLLSRATSDAADIQRLQDNVYLADRDLSQARSRDAARATQLRPNSMICATRCVSEGEARKERTLIA